MNSYQKRCFVYETKCKKARFSSERSLGARYVNGNNKARFFLMNYGNNVLYTKHNNKNKR
jgi:hypothetical protein